MASTLHLISVTLIFLILRNVAFTGALEEDELRSMLNVLRDSSYNLFGNAITTSELFYEVLSGKTFTFFAPTDSSLFALDMTNSASEYTSYLRCHVIPVRISLHELHRFPSGSTFSTLLKDNGIRFLFHRQSSVTSSDEVISVGGVRITSPGLFYSRNLAVHGLAGIINCRSHQQPLSMDNLPPPTNSPPSLFHQVSSHPPPPPVHAKFTGTFGSQSPRANSSEEDVNRLSNVPPILSQRQSPSPSPETGYSEAPVDLPPDSSPAYDVWSPLPEFGRSDSNSVPPPVEFSENDDPIAFPPSDFGNFENQGINNPYAELELGSSLSDDGLLILPEDYVPIISQENPNQYAMIEKSPEETGYSDEIGRDCPRTDGSFTQNSFFPSTTNMLCAKLQYNKPSIPSIAGVIEG